MSNALARKYEYEDDATTYPATQNKTLTTHRRGLPFTVVGTPDNQENTDFNSYAMAAPETTAADVEVVSRQALPTNEASKSRQWMSGSFSGMTAPSSFTTDFDLNPAQKREWQLRAPGLNQPAVAPTYASTLRTRRRSRPQLPLQTYTQPDHDLSYVRETVAVEQVYQEYTPRRVTAAIQPPAMPTFAHAETYKQNQEWLGVGSQWLVRNKAVCLLVLVGLLTAILVLPKLGQPSNDTVLAYGDAAVSSVSQQNPPQIAGAGNGDNLQSAPSITPDRINQVLNQYHSPAAGVGQTMYDLGKQYGIDPAFALAFFIHESSAGTKGVATVTKSIGNIRVTAGYEGYAGFRKYPTWEAGIEDWYKLIKNLYIDGWHLNTLQTIVPKYAPSADHNDPLAYINQVHDLVVSWRNGK